MGLTHADVLKIQTAIDAYEKKFPAKPSPSAAEALAWEANKRDGPADENGDGRAGVLGRLSARAFPGSFRLTAVRWFSALNVFKRPSPIA